MSRASIHWLEVVEDTLTLMHDFDGETPIFVDGPPKLVPRLNIEASAEAGGDCHHSLIAHFRFRRAAFSCHTSTY